MRKLVLLVWVTLGLGVLAWGAPQIVARVVEVSDGITIVVRMEALPFPAPANLTTNSEVTVRYIGVQPAPGVSPSALRNLNVLLVEGKQVFLELDEVVRDETGTLLAYVYLDQGRKLMANAVLVATELFSHLPLPGASRYDRVLAYLDQAPWSTPRPVCPVVYSWNEAGKHVGETACVEGPVVSVGTSRAGDVFLNLGKPYPDPGRFTLYIPARFVGKFEAAFGTRFWANLKGVTVRALGEIRLYQGLPEIQLSEPENLLILR